MRKRALILAAFATVTFCLGCRELPGPYIPSSIDYQRGEMVVQRIAQTMEVRIPPRSFEIDATRFELIVRLLDLPAASVDRVARQVDTLKRDCNLKRELVLEFYRDGGLVQRVVSNDPDRPPFRLPRVPVNIPVRSVVPN